MRARFRGFSFRVSAWAVERAGFFIEWLMEDAGGEGGGNACGRFGSGALDAWRTAGRGSGGLDAAEG